MTHFAAASASDRRRAARFDSEAEVSLMARAGRWLSSHSVYSRLTDWRESRINQERRMSNYHHLFLTSFKLEWDEEDPTILNSLIVREKLIKLMILGRHRSQRHPEHMLTSVHHPAQSSIPLNRPSSSMSRSWLQVIMFILFENPPLDSLFKSP